MTSVPEQREPALTPEGWNAVRDLDLASAAPDMVARKFRATSVERNPRHALAALCLYQQPFGFTQEDVDEMGAIRADYAALLSRSMGLHAAKGLAILATLDGVLSRIASLLPPPEKP